MRSLRLLTLLVAALLAALTQADPSTPKGEAEWLEATLKDAMASRYTLGKADLAPHPFHYVFLFDSSQAGSKSAYRKYVQSVIEEFLKRRLPEPGGTQSYFSIYPYQVDLYTSPPYFTSRAPLTEGNIGKVGGILPASPFDFAPETGRFGHSSHERNDYRGHDHINARKAAMALVEAGESQRTAGGKVPSIYIQFTPTYFSEIPGHPEIDADIRGADSRTAGLEGTGLFPYDVDGNPRESDFPDLNLPTIKVYVWLYGPESFNDMLTLKATETVKPDPPRPIPPKPIPSQPAKPSRWPAFLILLAAAAAAVWYFTKPVRVTISQGSREMYGGMVRPWQTVGIYGPNAQKVGPHSVVLPPEAAISAPPDLLAKVIARPTGSYVEGHLCSVDGPGVRNGRLPLDGKRSFRLKSKDGNVVSSSILVKIG